MSKWFGSIALALAITAPAHAQLLGGAAGGGGLLGGSLGGGGQLGGPLGGTVDRTVRTVRSSSATEGAVRADRSADTRSGRASASGNASGSSAVDGVVDASGRSLGGSASGSGAVGGNADAQLIGTDAVAGIVRDGVATGRSAVGTARSGANNAVSAARDTSGLPANGSSSAAGSGSLTGGLGANQLALAGTAAAQAAGTFDVARGMDVTDARGRVIGTVDSVRSTANGTVSAVTIAVGDRLATLPAANFSGSGNLLVSAMGRGDVRDAARSQSAAEAQ